jgi:hypothetical protein
MSWEVLERRFEKGSGTVYSRRDCRYAARQCTAADFKPWDKSWNITAPAAEKFYALEGDKRR